MRLRSEGKKPSGVQVPQVLSVAEHDLASAGKANYAVGVELRKGSRDRFEREAQIVSNVPAAHWQRHHTGRGQTAVHLKQEACYALHSVLSTKKQHMIFSVPEFASGHGPEAPGNLNGAASGLFKTATLDQANCGIDDRFGGQSMDRSGLQPEDVAGKVERPYLTPSVG
jgi:hypothetical protein